MANPEHLDILRQGVSVWNKWRMENPNISPDLCHIELNSSDFCAVNLMGTDFDYACLGGARLEGVNLSGASFRGANLGNSERYRANVIEIENDVRASLSRTVLEGANFMDAYLRGVDFTDAHLRYAQFLCADLAYAYLKNADLNGTYLEYVNLDKTRLVNADLNEAIMKGVRITDVDLSDVKGLETVKHTGPSTIGIDTIIRSQGNIPEIFLRGAGVPDSFIEYAHSLVARPIDYYTCFLSYSSKDQEFAQRLYNDLQAMGVRCWFAPHDMKIGDRIRPRIDESIRLYDKLLLILSQHSVCSQWVEHEVETAIGKELESKPNVLFPIRLDNVVMESKTGWASHIKLTRHVGDFTDWKDYDRYQAAFNRLLRDLKAESKTTL